jgi:hypothetical protein
MKCSGLKFCGGIMLLALAPVSAFAHVDVNVDLGFGVPVYVAPPPVYYEPPPRYYSPAPPVYYGPRVIYEDRDREHGHGHHDNGRHRGHRGHGDDD